MMFAFEGIRLTILRTSASFFIRRWRDMTYPPLSQVRDTLNVRCCRSPMPPEVFRALSQRNDLKGWKQVGGHLALFAVTGNFAWLFWAQEQRAAFALALFLHGTVGSFFSGTAPTSWVMARCFRPRP